MTTTEAQQLASGDEVGRFLYLGIVLRSTPGSVAIFWETHKMGETTTYVRTGAELQAVTLKRKAAQKSADAQRNGATNGDTHRSNGMALPLVRSSQRRRNLR